MNISEIQSQMDKKKVFPFWDKIVWSCCQKICILRREYLSSGVNVIKNSLKISDVTKADIFQLDDLKFIEKYQNSGAVLTSAVFRDR